ncbi:coiled-coil domain-containing protein 8 [Carex littledalei]|uniref:Coiled-coil domain-containing protein 8 n=1 Tax=Carex littledalei TaxID=544730 RepID=A0A833R0U3_9POAL|nr:coiled-coil domain-containing protein 8 [Carex littledalei]
MARNRVIATGGGWHTVLPRRRRRPAAVVSGLGSSQGRRCRTRGMGRLPQQRPRMSKRRPPHLKHRHLGLSPGLAEKRDIARLFPIPHPQPPPLTRQRQLHFPWKTSINPSLRYQPKLTLNSISHLLPSPKQFLTLLRHSPSLSGAAMAKEGHSTTSPASYADVIVHGWIEEPVPIIEPVDPTPDQSFFDEVQAQRLLPTPHSSQEDPATITVAFEVMYSLWERLKPGKERDEIEKAIGASPFFRRKANQAPQGSTPAAASPNTGPHSRCATREPPSPVPKATEPNTLTIQEIESASDKGNTDIHQTLLNFIHQGNHDKPTTKEDAIPAHPGECSAATPTPQKLSWADMCEEEERAQAEEIQPLPISPFKEDYLRQHIPSSPEPQNPCQRPWIFSGPNPKPHGSVPTTHLIFSSPSAQPPHSASTNRTPPAAAPNPAPPHPNPQPAAAPHPKPAAAPNPAAATAPNPKPAAAPNPAAATAPNPNPIRTATTLQPPLLPSPIANPALLPSPIANQHEGRRSNNDKKRKGKAVTSSQGPGPNPRHSARLSGKRPQTRFFVRNSKAKSAVGSAEKKKISENLESAGIAAALEAEQLTQVPLTQQQSDQVDVFCGISTPLVADYAPGSEPELGEGLDAIPHEIGQASQYVMVPTESQGENTAELYEESLLPSIESEPEELSDGESSDG